MSVASRLISGSAASWAIIAVTMISQLALVPIYLNYWTVETYGVWLAIQAILSVLSTIDFGHQTFLGYEFLRFGDDNRKELRRFLWSGIVMGIIISAVQVILIVVIVVAGAMPYLIGDSSMNDKSLIFDAGIVLILQSFTWVICIAITGLASRALAPFGYFPRASWWRFLYAIVTALVPLAAVVLGGDLLTTGIVYTGALILYSVPLYYDLFKLLGREKIYFIRPSFKLGYSNFSKSLALSLRSLLESIRQQGVRLFITPFSGVVGLTAFSTMRTGANVALQGLNTIIHPIMPDLMRFLHQRDQARSEAAFATIWIVVLVFLSPGVVLFQSIIEPFYILWTQGKIPFDPLLFGILSLGVLVYAVIQPAMAIVVGNNLVRIQLGLSAVSAVIVIVGIVILMPVIGILGAGIALLVAEIVASIGYFIYARRWLSENGLLWPKNLFSIAITSVCISTVIMSGMIWLPQAKWIILGASVPLFLWNIWRFWNVLPLIVTQRVRYFIANLPGMKRLFYN